MKLFQALRGGTNEIETTPLEGAGDSFDDSLDGLFDDGDEHDI